MSKQTQLAQKEVNAMKNENIPLMEKLQEEE